MKTVLKITNAIAALVMVMTMTACQSDEVIQPVDEAPMIEESWTDFDNENHDSDLLGHTVIKYHITPTLVSDSVFYAPLYDGENIRSRSSNIYSVPLNVSPQNNKGLYQVSFKVKNVTVRYQTINTAWIPTDTDAINLDIEVNKNSENMISSPKIQITDVAPKQNLRVGVSITSNEGGSYNTYIIDFIAAINGANAVIRDMSHAKK